MSIQNRNILKSYFNTGDTPTESNFADLIDSMASLGESQTFTQPQNFGGVVYIDGGIPSTYTALSAAIIATDTTIPVASAAGFPAAGVIRLGETEYVSYSGVDVAGNKLLNCVRGLYGTPAVAFTKDSYVHVVKLLVRSKDGVATQIPSLVVNDMGYYTSTVTLYTPGNVRTKGLTAGKTNGSIDFRDFGNNSNVSLGFTTTGVNMLFTTSGGNNTFRLGVGDLAGTGNMLLLTAGNIDIMRLDGATTFVAVGGNFAPAGQMHIRSQAAGNTGFVVQGYGAANVYSQTADLLKLQSFDGTNVADLVRVAANGQLFLTQGSATAPAIVFPNTGGNTTGLFSSYSNSQPVVGFAIAGTDRFNVGFNGCINANLNLQMLNSKDLVFKGGGITGKIRLGLDSTVSGLYRTADAGTDITPDIIIDPFNNAATGNSYAMDTANGFSFLRSNGTRRISRWFFNLANNVDTAGAEASDLQIKAKNPASDTLSVDSKVKVSSLAGTGKRVVSADASGNLTATSAAISNTTIQAQLTSSANWTGNNYTGPAITGVSQGQFHYDSGYFYFFVTDTMPLRMVRA